MNRYFWETHVPAGASPAIGDGGALSPLYGERFSPEQVWTSGPTVFIPESYVPGYQYPLICFLHDHDRSERDLWGWFPKVSDQNFIGVGIRAPFLSRSGLPGQFRWRGQRPDASWGTISEAVTSVRQEWNIHPDRIFLHGVGNGAIIALQQFLLNHLSPPDEDFHIAGVSCTELPRWWPRVLPPIETEISGRLLFLDGCQEVEEFAAHDALREAGADVCLKSAKDKTPAQALNRWIMSTITSTIW